MSRRLFLALALAVALVPLALECWEIEIRHTTVPVALEPRCTTWRIFHPDPRRKLRIVNDCHPLDTLFVPR